MLRLSFLLTAMLALHVPYALASMDTAVDTGLSEAEIEELEKASTV